MLDELESLSDQSYDTWDRIGGNAFAGFIISLVSSTGLGLMHKWFLFWLVPAPLVIISATLAAISVFRVREEDRFDEPADVSREPNQVAGRDAAAKNSSASAAKRMSASPNPLRFRHP